MKKIDIVFMGTPEFAVSILAKLLTDESINIIGVITAPDKPAGRGRKMHASAVKQFALDSELNILQPTKLKEEDFVSELAALKADLFVVVAFRMLPEVVWGMPRLGTINLHASLLPQYRGAAPINWAIINGETETGVTTFFIEREIDTGDIIEQNKTAISENTTVGELYTELMELGAETTLSTVKKIMNGNAQGLDQSELIQHEELKPAPKIFKQDCKIDFSTDVENVHNFCRGLDPYPGAWSTVNIGNDTVKTVKFFATSKTEIRSLDSTELKSDDSGILVPCSDFYLRVVEIQLEGKRRMSFKEFIAGNKINSFSL
ncbi:MAG: methionyl-tRNA formyltransferase [Crocinitomicaceae bacterium]|nr:methionyl-tRNA formyltransferase [Crocinitomicaceae bacterium]